MWETLAEYLAYTLRIQDWSEDMQHCYYCGCGGFLFRFEGEDENGEDTVFYVCPECAEEHYEEWVGE